MLWAGSPYPQGIELRRGVSVSVSTPGCITRSAISITGLILSLWSASRGVGSGRECPGTCCRGLCRVHIFLLIQIVPLLVRVLTVPWVSVNVVFLYAWNPLGPGHIHHGDGSVHLIVPGLSLSTRSRWRQVPSFGVFCRMQYYIRILERTRDGVVRDREFPCLQFVQVQ